jgi:hypothetical protein
VVVVVEDGLGERDKKNSFHTRNFFFFSMKKRVRSRLAYLEDEPFPIYFLFSDITRGVGQRAYTDLKE